MTASNMGAIRRAFGLTPPAAPPTGTDAESWADRWAGALCTQTDGDLWFSDFVEERRVAVKLCRECPLITECAVMGLKEDHGIWGGIDRNDRRPQPFERQRYHNKAAS